MPVREALPLKRWAAIGYKPQPWAIPKLHLRAEPMITLTTARQIGKSFAGAALLDELMSKEAPDGNPAHIGLIAPTYAKTRFILDRWLEWQQRAFGRDSIRTNFNEHWALNEFTGAKVTWVSADDPASVVGHTFSHAIGDECQNISDLVHDKFLPTLAVRNAPFTSFGTPDITPEQTWFKSQWILGQDEDAPDFYSATVSVYESPLWTPDKIAQQKALLSEREFRMLMLGEWVDEEGMVFVGYESALLPGVIENPEPRPGIQYVIGCDVAVYNDFTVLIIGERNTGVTCAMYRWNSTDPFVTYDRIQEIAERWNNALIVIDSTGIGLPMSRELQQRGLRVMPQTISPKTKMPMIGGLQAALEHRRIMIQPWPALIRELKAFVYHETPSGLLTASAAAGYNDDTIMALVMFHLGCRMRVNGGGRGANWLEGSDSRSLRERALILGR